MCEDKPFESTFLKDGTEEPPREIWDQLENEFVADYRKEESSIPKTFMSLYIKRFRKE